MSWHMFSGVVQCSVKSSSHMVSSILNKMYLNIFRWVTSTCIWCRNIFAPVSVTVLYSVFVVNFAPSDGGHWPLRQQKLGEYIHFLAYFKLLILFLSNPWKFWTHEPRLIFDWLGNIGDRGYKRIVRTWRKRCAFDEIKRLHSKSVWIPLVENYTWTEWWYLKLSNPCACRV